MAIMLTPDQVPKFWEAIKFAVVNVEMIDEAIRGSYLNRLLYLLLSSKAQCFVRLSNNRKLQMIGLTSIEVDPATDDKTLFAYALYSFERVSDDEWRKDFDALVQWAKANGCKSISTWSNNERAIYLLENVGMTERYRMFKFDITGGAE
jgi:hypothetical protein